MFKHINAAAIFFSLTLLGISSAEACTDIRVTAEDGTVLISRSMEYSVNTDTHLRTSTRGRQYEYQLLNGKSAARWTAKYGYVYLDVLDADIAVDGMNEHGLSMEALYLPGETRYQAIPTGKELQAVPYFALGDWILSQFKTVDEVEAALKNVYIFEQRLPNANDMVFPLHFSIFDVTGKGIVVEFVEGEQRIYSNDLGVMTNSPQYDWQMTNLRNYVNMSPFNPTPTTQGGMTFVATGQGAGMIGLPGDFTPPSRFIKMAKLLQFSDVPADSQGALNMAQHLMNNVDITLGTVVAKEPSQVRKEYTQWVVFKDLTHRKFYYRTYGNLTVRSIALEALDFSSTGPRLKMAIEGPAPEVSVQDSFMGAVIGKSP